MAAPPARHVWQLRSSPSSTLGTPSVPRQLLTLPTQCFARPAASPKSPPLSTQFILTVLHTRLGPLILAAVASPRANHARSLDKAAVGQCIGQSICQSPATWLDFCIVEETAKFLRLPPTQCSAFRKKGPAKAAPALTGRGPPECVCWDSLRAPRARHWACGFMTFMGCLSEHFPLKYSCTFRPNAPRADVGDRLPALGPVLPILSTF